ncbi:hypothetical protein QQS21_002144 [Conoideocrella luteorostrata]|uniref:Carboxylic ester hydrolase n=1 Tax=Conoideocrella luteorostrata TaxID=1105319 RepID=A0AAJ0FXM2_9HYPO|nr:hypothetical protein QQS21_002144 [Conoideocrella luteorostrata]
MGNALSYNIQEHTLSLGKQGKLKGLQYDDKARRYAAVPYALPPIGQHRWHKPRPLPSSFSYTGSDGKPFDATAFLPPCAQEDRELSTGNVADDAVMGTEDCLYVNIWTPVPRDEDTSTKKWPVMVWLHGGWFQVGNACQEPAMDPTELISTGKLNAIVVAISYRLNIFGFLTSKAFLEENSGTGAVNFGLWDQRLALEWIYSNIGMFGGDVSNITLAGRSAGAYGVEAQILHDFRRQANPLAGKLFHKAWMSSNAIPAQPKTVHEAESQFDEVCEHFKIPATLSASEKLSALRQISQADLLKCLRLLKNHTFRPVTDDLFFHSGMIDYIEDGTFAKEFQARNMKLLIGEVANEETLYAQFNGPTEGKFESLLLQTANYYSPKTTEMVLHQYTVPNTSDLKDWKDLFGRIIADGQVRASSRFLIDSLSRNGVSTRYIWRYRVNYRLSFIDESVAPMDYGVSHAMDGPLWNFSINQLPSDEERVMMTEWIQILVAFVNGEEGFDFGTRNIDDVKVLTDQKTIVVEKDARYDELRNLGEVFSKS